LAGALDLIAGLGGGTVEGYPEDAGSVPAGFLYHGALSTYDSLGFIRDRKIGKHRWVVTRVVEPVLDALEADRFWARTEAAVAWRRLLPDHERDRLVAREADVDIAFDGIE
jgi:hypothetical protein